jgi:hypothetical protein
VGMGCGRTLGENNWMSGILRIWREGIGWITKGKGVYGILHEASRVANERYVRILLNWKRCLV